MNDDQLIQLLQDKTPEELSVEEIELLQSRLAESDQLRQALFQQLEMEEYLATALGRVNVSIDSITATRHTPGSGPRPMMLAVVLLVCLGVIGFFALLVVPGLKNDPSDVAEVTDAEEPPADADGTEETDEPIDEPADEKPPPEEIVEEPDESPDPPPEEPDDPPEEVEQPVEPPQPQGPWVAGLAAPPQPFSQTWYVDFDTTKYLPDKEGLETWLEKVPGQHVRFHEEKISNVNHGAFVGLCQLSAPFPEDAALRFSTAKADQLRLHCFRRQQGVSIYWNTRHGAADRWASYATTREAGKPTPITFQLTDTDEGRDEVCDARYGPTLMLFWHDGDLVLMRGDIEMARAGFPDGPPEEIYFEGQATFRGIEMLRLADHPAPPDAWPEPYEVVQRPADLDWQGELPENSVFEKREDGSVHLAMDNAEQFGWTSIPMPTDRIRFVEVEIDNATPGAQIWLGQPEVRNGAGEIAEKAGRPNNPTLAFASNNRDKRLVAVWRPRDENLRTFDYHEIQEKQVPYANGHLWARFLVAAGWVRCWISADGEEWAVINWGEPWYAGQMTQLSIGCSKQTPGAQITLKTIRYRELPAVNGMVDDELLARAQAFPGEHDYFRWLVAVTQAQPAGVDATDWRTACALRTLAIGSSSKTMQALIDLLEKTNRRRHRGDLQQQLAVLKELPMLASLWEKLPDDQPIELHKRYHAIGHELAASGNIRPYTSVRRAMMTELPLARHFFKAFDADLVQYEMLQLAYRGRWDDVDEFVKQLQFYGGQQLEQAVPLTPWLETLAAKQQPARLGEGVVRLRDDWQNPLVEEYSKEAYNVMAEFHATVESESHDDAARMIAELDPYSMHGLVPSASDKDLLVSVATAVRSAMNRNDELAAVVNDESEIGTIRVNKATTQGNVDAVRLATVQFHGTVAAGMAHRWLGDRALAGGEFVTAMDEYRRAKETLGILEKRQLEPRIRLAAAMLGMDYGTPASTSVAFGEITMSAEEFERLIEEMRTVHANSSGALTSIASEYIGDAPSPSGIQVHRRGRLDGHPGEDSGNVDGRVREYEVPWLPRQLGITVDRKIAYINNRFHVAAYDLNSQGKRLWQSPPPPSRGKTRDWKLVPMRPVVTDRHVFVRQLSKDGPVLLCLGRDDGKHVWVTQPQNDEALISDPVLTHGKLFVLVLREMARGDDVLRLVSFSLDTGEPIDGYDLLNIRDSWEERRVCSTTALPGGILASFGGFVLNVDFDGNVRWARRQLMVPAAQDITWVTQRFDPPLVTGDRVIIASPGVRTIDCLDIDYGELKWRAVLPNVDRMIGLCAGNIIVHAGDDFLALDVETGEQQWKTQLLAPFDAELCGGEHGLLIAHKVPAPDHKDRFCPELVWLDGTTGEITAQTLLPELHEQHPQFGPLLKHDDRLWSFYAPRREDPHRDLIELQPQGEATAPINTGAAEDPWLAHTRDDLREAMTDQFPQWRLLSAARRDGFGYLADIHNEKDVVALPAQADAPIVLAREIAIPASGKPRLKLRLGSDPNHNWRLVVRHGEKVLHEEEMEWAKLQQVWKDRTINLKTAAGKSGWLSIEAHFVSGGDHTRTYWKRISVEF